MLSEKKYQNEQLQSLKKLFSTENDTEKLKLMKLEQDAAAKQAINVNRAHKQVRGTNTINLNAPIPQ